MKEKVNKWIYTFYIYELSSLITKGMNSFLIEAFLFLEVKY